ncbi:OmpA family protein [Rudanella paleaurantiibacter]|uniref:OmpA family protein n=1 Tax=Rudanella paleaurantiibacter TaxID=2614655 RepID=A0A7J5U5W2_9BACT|nr:OmpA family protein [Rudanella paleaurantiibacter]KAB7733238.1 OmpA family protein [Rudanella paleaurantiibacter]
MNFFAAFNDIVTPDVINKAAVFVEESAPKTQKAIEGLGLTVLGGLLKRTTSEIGVNQLFNYIQKGNYDGSQTAGLSSALKDPAQTNLLIAHGNDTISHLLPAMKSSIANMISSYAGIRNSSAVSLLGLTSGIVLDVLGKQVREQKMDADGLAAALFEQREDFVQKVPESLLPKLVEKLGLQQVMAGIAGPARRGEPAATPGRPISAPGPAVTAPVYDASSDSDNTNGLVGKIGIGLVLAAIIGAGAYMVYHNSRTGQTDDAGEVAETTVTTDAGQADTVARSMAVPVDTSAMRTKPATTSAVAPVAPSAASTTATAGAGTLTTALNGYMADVTAPKGRTFSLSAVSFQPGSTSLTPGSEATVTEIANFLKANPAAQIRLVGYANDAGAGTTNKALSFKRVNTIKSMLVAQGINYIRVDAVGLGTGSKPKPGDSTGTRTPSLRKIDMKVVYK